MKSAKITQKKDCPNGNKSIIFVTQARKNFGISIRRKRGKTGGKKMKSTLGKGNP